MRSQPSTPRCQAKDRVLRRDEDQRVAEERIEYRGLYEGREQFEPVAADAGGVGAAGQQRQPLRLLERRAVTALVCTGCDDPVENATDWDDGSQM